MFKLLFSILITALGIFPMPLADWTPVPMHSLVYETGECMTGLVGYPPWWGAVEQCFDGVQIVSKATIQTNTVRYSARGVSEVRLHIIGQFQFIKVWVGSAQYNTYLCENDCVIRIPNGWITLQAIHNGGAPAEIYSISME